MEICGWGRNLKVQAKILRPKTVNSIRSFITTNKKIIARGLGRSYGDSANNNIVIDTTILNKIIKFDEKRGLITCESGVSINSINEKIKLMSVCLSGVRPCVRNSYISNLGLQ
jgi:FAD/FMN-containing dehydrogenase